MKSNMKRAVRGTNRRAQYLGHPREITARAFGDGALHDGNEKGSRHNLSGPMLQDPGGPASNFSKTRSHHSSDAISIRSSLSLPHEFIEQNDQSRQKADPSESNLQHALGGRSYSAQETEDPVRRKILQVPSLLRSRDSTASSSQASINAGSNHQKLDNARDETQILLIGDSREVAVLLQKSMKLAYGHNYTKADKTAYRISILHDVVGRMRDLLSVMENLGISLAEQSSVSYVDTLNHTRKGDWEFLPPALSTAIAALWKDPGVIAAYHRQDAVTKLDEME
ncbi:MAG: hypothetical protein Q9207_002189 [Kuettlingeria erythrocarpa]